MNFTPCYYILRLSHFGVFCTNVAEIGKGCEREWGPFIWISRVLVQKRHFTQRICDVIDFGKKKTFLPTLIFYPFKSTILSTDLKLNTSTKIYSTILKPILAFLKHIISPGVQEPEPNHDTWDSAGETDQPHFTNDFTKMRAPIKRGNECLEVQNNDFT